MSTKLYFVDAPPKHARPLDGETPRCGYTVHADSAAEALRVVRAFRKGAQWALDLVEVVR